MIRKKKKKMDLIIYKIDFSKIYIVSEREEVRQSVHQNADEPNDNNKKAQSCFFTFVFFSSVLSLSQRAGTATREKAISRLADF